MEVHELDMSTEKNIITGMITDTAFLKGILPFFDYEYLDMKASKHVAKWVIGFYEKYEKSPGLDIQEIF